jgi:hypothetical protein
MKFSVCFQGDPEQRRHLPRIMSLETKINNLESVIDQYGLI